MSSARARAIASATWGRRLVLGSRFLVLAGAPDCRFAGWDPAPWRYGDARDAVQTGFDVAGRIPGAGEPFDGLNALISLARGDAAGAALAAAAMVPVAGMGATSAKLAARWGDRATELANVGPRGVEFASEELLQAVQRHGRILLQGPDVDRHLDRAGANASQIGDYILLRRDPRKIEVLEEFLHGTQRRLGLAMSEYQLEIHVKEFMIRHHRMLGIAREDVTWLRAALEEYR